MCGCMRISLTGRINAERKTINGFFDPLKSADLYAVIHSACTTGKALDPYDIAMASSSFINESIDQWIVQYIRQWETIDRYIQQWESIDQSINTTMDQWIDTARLASDISSSIPRIELKNDGMPRATLRKSFPHTPWRESIDRSPPKWQAQSRLHASASSSDSKPLPESIAMV